MINPQSYIVQSCMKSGTQNTTFYVPLVFSTGRGGEMIWGKDYNKKMKVNGMSRGSKSMNKGLGAGKSQEQNLVPLNWNVGYEEGVHEMKFCRGWLKWYYREPQMPVWGVQNQQRISNKELI